MSSCNCTTTPPSRLRTVRQLGLVHDHALWVDPLFGWMGIMRSLAINQFHVFLFLFASMFVASFGMFNLAVGFIAENAFEDTLKEELEPEFKKTRAIMEITDEMHVSDETGPRISSCRIRISWIDIGFSSIAWRVVWTSGLQQLTLEKSLFNQSFDNVGLPGDLQFQWSSEWPFAIKRFGMHPFRTQGHHHH